MTKSDPTPGLCRQFYVLKANGPTSAVRYVCYEDITTGSFAVSMIEELSAPYDEAVMRAHQKEEVEHFIREGVNRWFDTLAEAIADFPLFFDEELR